MTLVTSWMTSMDSSTIILTIVSGGALIFAFIFYSNNTKASNMKVSQNPAQNESLGKDECKGSFVVEDYSPYIEEELEKEKNDVKLNADQVNLISRVKLARQRAINNKIKESLSDSDLRMEKVIESQQLAKIYALLNENRDDFGTSFSIDEVRDQMTMYKNNKM